jgi:hypothetical protein
MRCATTSQSADERDNLLFASRHIRISKQGDRIRHFISIGLIFAEIVAKMFVHEK